MYSAKSIANLILEEAGKRGMDISPLKLQKLVYYAHGHWLGYHGKPLIADPVQAWQYGPVIESLYHEFKRFGSGPIQGYATEHEFDPQGVGHTWYPVPPPDDTEVRQMANFLLDSYGKHTAIQLSGMTHAPGSPWDLTWRDSPRVPGRAISNDLIQRHFKKYADQVNAKPTGA